MTLFPLRTRLGRSAAVLGAFAAMLVLPGLGVTASDAATSARPLTGIWSGMTLQELPPLGPDADFVDWKQHIVVTAYAGRLLSLSTSVRYTCPDPTNPMAGDISLRLGWKRGLGPKLTPHGGFSLVARDGLNILTGKMTRLPMPVSIAGALGPGGASGRFDLSKGDCSGKGSWRARRTSRR